MVRVIEMVLDVPISVGSAWFASRESSHHAQTAHGLDASLIDALDALPRAVRTSGDTAAGADDPRPRSPPVHEKEAAALLTRVSMDGEGAFAAAGLQLWIESVAHERRMMVSRLTSFCPGVTVREPLHEVALEGEVTPESALAGAPDAIRHALEGADSLTPCATLACERCCWQWQSADELTVEIAFDRISAQPDGDAPLQRELRLSIPYVEDAVARCVAALFELSHELVAALPAFPALATAFDHAWAGAGSSDTPPMPARAKSIDLTGLCTPQAALIAIGNNLAQHWFGNDAGVRDAISAEFVHQLRVSQRRLKTAMRIFPHWADDAWKTRIAPDLKWLGGILGEARDWDVFVDTTLPALAAADTGNGRWSSTRERADLRRLEARERVQAAVASTRYAQLALAWLEWLSVLPLREPPAKGRDQSLHAYAKKRVRKYYERLVSAPKLTTLDEKARHKERIQAKYLRYTLEFFDSIASRKTRSKCAKTVSRLQSVLGDGNDVAVALGYLEALGVEPYQAGFANGWGEAAKRYTAQEGERLLRSLRKPKISRGDTG
jgi:CHAD domain-containing protein